ncbi:MAG: O-antigen ligase family protein [Planctomycetes bacterium]|nr:O-antigen ligase family protein [Planctomycetota bacterium]
MPPPAATHDSEPERLPGERLQALLMLLPAAILAWPGPGSFLRDDWTATSTGSAVALFATLPALALLAFRGHARAARGWFLLLPLLAAGAFRTEELDPVSFTGDTFERLRATFTVLVAAAMLMSGASLSPAGRSVFARGAALLSIAFTAVALFDASNAHTGALGNTGSVSHAALAGAALSAFLVFDAFGPWTLVHGAALLLHLVYAWSVPVHAGVLALAAALAGLALFRSERRARAAWAGLALVAVLGALAPRFFASTPNDAPAASAPASTAAARPVAAGDTGGVAVRALVWKRTLAMVADHPFLGVGLGQFAARFPPYRDTAEIELSSHQRRLAQETEVEHAHCDYLTLLAEGGVVFAAGAFLLLALVARAAVRRLRGDDRVQAALGAAALALLANGLVHGVLFTDPVSSSLAFGAFGMLLGPVRADRPTLARRLAPWFLLFCAAVAASFAFEFVAQSRVLAPLERGDELTTEDVGRVIDLALEEAPYAPLPLSLRARWLEARGAEPQEVAEAWRALLAVRPYRVEVLMQLGLAQLRGGDEDGARGMWELAQRLDPGHPGLAWNRMTLALDEDRVPDATTLADELERAHRLDPDRLLSLATRLELEGKDASAQALWTRVAPEIANATPDQSFALAKARRAENDERLARALEVRAQRGYAREHALHGAWNDAVRSYRQMVRASGADPAPVRMQVELAAALLAAGKKPEAEALLADLGHWEQELAALPKWVVETFARERWSSR